jgi:ubiquinone/menaquinone biosynthesis C-methylase UbiE
LGNIWARHIEPSGQTGHDYWNYFAERLADLVTHTKGAAVLDIGTYDGNVLIKVLKKTGTGSYGIGIDIDRGGIEEGIAEAIACGLGNVTFAQMDAACMGFLPGMFDVVLANFVGWDYCFDFDRIGFTAPDSRMAEIMRVLKPGGQVGIGYWIEQFDIEWMAEVFGRYLPKSMKAIGGQITPYGRENPEGYQAILRKGGFHKIRMHVETATFVSPDTATWWRQMKQVARDYFEKMPELDRFKEQVLADLKRFQSSKGIHFDKTVGYAFGTKP